MVKKTGTADLRSCFHILWSMDGSSTTGATLRFRGGGAGFLRAAIVVVGSSSMRPLDSSLRRGTPSWGRIGEEGKLGTSGISSLDTGEELLPVVGESGSRATDRSKRGVIGVSSSSSKGSTASSPVMMVVGEWGNSASTIHSRETQRWKSLGAADSLLAAQIGDESWRHHTHDSLSSKVAASMVYTREDEEIWSVQGGERQVRDDYTA